MAYQSLYRRYRPQRFDEVRGQPHVVTALKNAARDGRVAHAYLFSGPRGTGKTSTARILAKVMNCEAPQDGEPCGECESCRAIESGRSFDVREYDAASNSKVDEMRALLENVATGSGGRTKVYILDEVHMLSPGASNALLKTLEEPPEHVVFVLCTTEAHKVLPTIRSRTQHLELTLLPGAELAEHVRWVVDDAGLEISDEAFDQVLRQGGGSARDTLSALERVVSTGGEAAADDRVDDLVDALADEDGGATLVALADHLARGRDPRVVGEELLGCLRDTFLHSMGVDVPHLPAGEAERVADWAARLRAPTITRALELLGEALVEMRQAPDPRVPLEVALIRLTRPDADRSADALLARVERLEAALADGPAPAPGASARPTPPRPASEVGEAGGAADAADRVGDEAGSEAAAGDATAAGDDGPPEPPGGGSPAAEARATLAANRPASRSGGTETTARAAAGDRAGAERPRTPKRTVAGRSRRGPAASEESSAPEEPSAPEEAASSSPPGDEAPPPPDPDATSVAEPPPPPAPASEEPAAAAASQPPPLDGFPTREDLTLAWGDTIVDALPNKVRNRFQGGRFVSVDDATAHYALDSKPLLDRAEAVRTEAEAALSEHFGRPIPIRLVLDEGGAAAPGEAEGADAGAAGRPAGPGAAAAGSVDAPAGADQAGPPADEDDIDPDELVDAEGDVATAGVDLLTQAFPGAEVVEGES